MKINLPDATSKTSSKDARKVAPRVPCFHPLHTFGEMERVDRFCRFKVTYKQDPKGVQTHKMDGTAIVAPWTLGDYRVAITKDLEQGGFKGAYALVAWWLGIGEDALPDDLRSHVRFPAYDRDTILTASNPSGDTAYGEDVAAWFDSHKITPAQQKTLDAAVKVNAKHIKAVTR